jgi:NADPH-dependent glutamate synthase beta subunit-like oxidoreductase
MSSNEQIGATHTNGHKPSLDELPDLYGWPRQNERGYRIDETPSGTYRPLKVIIIGAGASGISFAKFSREELHNVELQIYEKNHDIGGTWLENR